MRSEDRKRIAGELVAVAEVYGFELTEAALVVYLRALECYEATDVLAALRVAVTRCKFMPRPAEVIELIAEDDQAVVEAAWHELRRALRSPSLRESLPPATLEAVRLLGGFASLCMMQERDLDFMRGRFGDVFESALRRGFETPALPSAESVRALPAGRKTA